MGEEISIRLVSKTSDEGGNTIARPPSNVIIDTDTFFLDGTRSQSLRPFLRNYQNCLSCAFAHFVEHCLAVNEEATTVPHQKFQDITGNIETGASDKISQMIAKAIKIDGDKVSVFDDRKKTAFEEEHVQGFYDRDALEGAKALLRSIKQATEFPPRNQGSVQIGWYITRTNLGILPQYRSQLAAAFACAVSNAHINGRIITPSDLSDLNGSSKLLFTNQGASSLIETARSNGLRVISINPKHPTQDTAIMVSQWLGTRTP